MARFAELDTLPNVLQNFNILQPIVVDHNKQTVDPKGRWHTMIFKNEHPIVLELACGKGEYTCNMALAEPGKNFIGIDIKGNRMHRGAKRAVLEEIRNAFFLRIDINIIPLFFAAGEVDEIWITFPDPHLKTGKYLKRLTSPRFLEKYAQILKPGGIIHLKTDDPTLFAYTCEVISAEGHTLLCANEDIYAGELPHSFLSIRTYYEGMHLAEGRKIKYVSFQLKQQTAS